jgi:hypothetical protein
MRWGRQSENLFDNPIDCFTSPDSLPAIPVFLLMLMDSFVPYRTASDAIVLGCFVGQKAVRGWGP